MHLNWSKNRGNLILALEAQKPPSNSGFHLVAETCYTERNQAERPKSMGATFSFEKIKSFSSIPYSELFRKCEQVLRELNLQLTVSDESSGVIEAKKPVLWPFRSGQEIQVTVQQNSKVKIVEKVDLGSGILGGNPLRKDLITEKLFDMLKQKT